MKKDIHYYMSLPYTVLLKASPDGGYGVSIAELPGCISQGETIDEAIRMIEDAKLCWLETALEEGHEIPEPAGVGGEDYSGKFVVRVPKSLHRDLVRKAKEENVSLNQLTTYLLSSSIGKPVKK